MIAIASPIVIAVLVFFLNISILNRGMWGEAIGFSFLSLIASALVFSVMLPVLATDISDGTEVVWHANVIDEIKVGQSDRGMETLLKFALDGQPVQEVGISELTIYRDKEIDTPYVENVCGTTPDWVAPWDWGQCGLYLYLPADLELKLETVI